MCIRDRSDGGIRLFYTVQRKLQMVLALFHGWRCIERVHFYLFNLVYDVPIESHRAFGGNCLSILLSIGLLGAWFNMWHSGIFRCICFRLEDL